MSQKVVECGLGVVGGKGSVVYGCGSLGFCTHGSLDLKLRVNNTISKCEDKFAYLEECAHGKGAHSNTGTTGPSPSLSFDPSRSSLDVCGGVLGEAQLAAHA